MSFWKHAGFFLVWTIGITAAGAVVGAVAYPVGGLLFGLDATPGQLAVKGLRELAFLAFIWAPGTALVLTIHRAYRAKHPRE